jgi:hypothetical protein
MPTIYILFAGIFLIATILGLPAIIEDYRREHHK